MCMHMVSIFPNAIKALNTYLFSSSHLNLKIINLNIKETSTRNRAGLAEGLNKDRMSETIVKPLIKRKE